MRLRRKTIATAAMQFLFGLLIAIAGYVLKSVWSQALYPALVFTVWLWWLALFKVLDPWENENDETEEEKYYQALMKAVEVGSLRNE